MHMIIYHGKTKERIQKVNVNDLLQSCKRFVKHELLTGFCCNSF